MRGFKGVGLAPWGILLFGTLGVLLGACDQFAQYAHQAKGKPALAFADTLYDFGQVSSGAVVEHSYHVANAGTGVLQLTLEPPDCDCLTVRPWKLILAPGEHDLIRVAFNTRGFYGREFKRVAFASNTARGHFSLYLQAEIVDQQ